MYYNKFICIILILKSFKRLYKRHISYMPTFILGLSSPPPLPHLSRTSFPDSSAHREQISLFRLRLPMPNVPRIVRVLTNLWSF